METGVDAERRGAGGRQEPAGHVASAERGTAGNVLLRARRAA